jgi:cystathionine gamma-lyase
LAGAVVTKDEPLGERLAFLQNAMGGVAAPFESWLALRGLKTLHLRMDRHSENALAVAKELQGHRKVEAVHFPGLASHPQHALAKRQQHVWGGMLSFEVSGGLPAAKRCLRGLKVFRLAESLGSVESLVSHPATMTHAGLSAAERKRLGITPGLVRFSVGVEDAADLVADVKTALAKV